MVGLVGGPSRYYYSYCPISSSASFSALTQALSEWDADVSYLRLLHLAASTMEAEVEAALTLLLENGTVPKIERVKALVSPSVPDLPQIAAYQVDLGDYDALLTEVLQ